MTQREQSEQIANRLIDKVVGKEPSSYELDILRHFLTDIYNDRVQTKEFITFMRNRVLWLLNEKNDDVCLETSIMDADIPVGLKHSLIAAGKKTMRDVIMMPKSIVQKFRNIGTKKICALDAWFKKRGMEWK